MISKTDAAEMADEALTVASKIREHLVGRGGAIQGAILLELTSMWLAGHHPKMRDHVWENFVKTLDQMVPIQEREMFETRPRPEGWE